MHLLLADENFSAVSVEELRSLGYDILTLKELGLANRSFPDEDVLAKASVLRRVLLTFNRNDFIRLHKKSADHPGIIVCRFFSDRKELALKKSIKYCEWNPIWQESSFASIATGNSQIF